MNLNNQGFLSREVDQIVTRFNAWLRLHSRQFSELDSKTVLRRLYEFGGIGTGPLTPQSWLNGRRYPIAPVVTEAWDKLREMHGNERVTFNSEEPLLPFGVGDPGKSPDQPATSGGEEAPLFPASTKNYWNEQNKKN